MTQSLADFGIEALLEESVSCRYLHCGKPATHTLVPHDSACRVPSGCFICGPCIKKARDFYRDGDYAAYGYIQCEVCLKIFASPEAFIRVRPI